LKIRTIFVTVAVIAAPGAAVAHDRGDHQSYAAGEPGDSAKPARTIEVVMTEMEYKPFLIEVKRGEQIRFVIRNAGTEDHEFLLSTTKENLAHAEMMKKHPHMKHEEPNGVTLAPKKSAELLWKFTKTGSFEYSCLIPDHRDYGMTGRVVVK
jgi:uncharacterized cupredoxin-like copper-binding protein